MAPAPPVPYMCRTIIAGSRGITDYSLVETAMQLAANRGIGPVTQVLCGMARGVDMLGRRWALEHGVAIRDCPAEWELHGRSAGYKRNAFMAHNADALVALWDGYSRGTESMIRLAKGLHLPTFVFDPKRWAA